MAGKKKPESIKRAYAGDLEVDGKIIPAGTEIALSSKRAAYAEQAVGLYLDGSEADATSRDTAKDGEA